MADAAALMGVLQHADSFFPSGAVSFSWGLEGLHRDGELRGEDAVSRFIAAQLRFRWATFDRPILREAHRAAGDRRRLVSLDRETEALSLGHEFREASRRQGLALLSVHARLETEGAGAYRELVLGGSARGHLPVAQGLVWRGVGISADAAEVVSAHTFCITYLGAAVRLGILGHIGAQRILGALRETLAAILGVPTPSIDEIGVFTPHADIASMRHETQRLRLFAN